jgi:hypothetical protein
MMISPRIESAQFTVLLQRRESAGLETVISDDSDTCAQEFDDFVSKFGIDCDQLVPRLS